MKQFIDNHIIAITIIDIICGQIWAITFGLWLRDKWELRKHKRNIKNQEDLPRLCDKCKKGTLVIDYSMTLLSMPPQYNASCLNCGWKGSVPC